MGTPVTRGSERIDINYENNGRNQMSYKTEAQNSMINNGSPAKQYFSVL